MAFLNKLERIFGRFAIPSLSLVLIVGQVLAWLALYRHVLSPDVFLLVPAEAAQPGQWWHLFSFLVLPPLVLNPSLGILLMLIGWWMFYLMGTALETFWGTFRYNVFLFVGWALCVGAGFLCPDYPVTNIFLFGSVFLAFAYLNPDFEMLLFFILPVKIKWLAMLTWVFYGYKLVVGPGTDRVQTAAVILNFMLFFGHDVWLTARLRGRTITKKTVNIARPVDNVRHRCRVCGKTNVSDPQLDFRYCSKCVGEVCYCSEHIFNHPHVTAEPEQPKV